jgi:hypothetical protein
MDQRKANKIQKKVAAYIIFMSLLMFLLGVGVVSDGNPGTIELLIAALSLASGGGLLYGGIMMIRKANRSNRAVDEYEKHIRTQLKSYEEAKKNPEIAETEKINNGINHATHSPETGHTMQQHENPAPDIIAKWDYTAEEWTIMRKRETRRRLIEGAWVSLLVGLIGGWILSSSRELPFWFAALFSFGIGLLIAYIKVRVSEGMLKQKSNNAITITRYALLINDQFKVLHDGHFRLEYVKIVFDKFTFIEFSMKWPTRNGTTNDQYRILVPDKHKAEISHVLEAFRSNGVEIK